MKEILTELLVNTIVALFVTLLFYIVSLVDSWQEASSTFAMAFIVLAAMTVYKMLKKK